MVIAYLDECGRGPLWGDVYACALIWDENKEISPPFKVKSWDSKKLTERRRNMLSDYIKENALEYSIGICSSDEIDEHNILNATMMAFHRALDKLSTKFDMIYVDGSRFETYCTRDDFIEHKCIIKGDDTYICIGMASIIAKVSRDKYIYDYCKENPELNEKYKLEKNKGYGTKEHLLGLSKYGMSENHRRSFKLKNNIK